MPPKPQSVLADNRPADADIAGGGRLRNVPKVYGLSKYGNPDVLRFIADYQDKDAKAGNRLALRYTRTLEATLTKFKCSESYAAAQIRALRAYRMDCLADELPGMTVEAVDELRRIAAKAEKAGFYFAAIRAIVERMRLIGAYRGEQGQPEPVGPTLKDQLGAVMGVLPPPMRRHLEEILLTVEQAATDGRLKLEERQMETADVIDASATEAQ